MKIPMGLLGIFLTIWNSSHAQQPTTTPPNFAQNVTLPYDRHMTNLEKKLLSNYGNAQIRPVKNISAPMKIRLLPMLHHIEQVNEEEQTMTVHGSLAMMWTDDFMKWDINEFNGVDRLTLHAVYMWQPDIMLYNSAQGRKMGPLWGTGEKTVAHYTGSVNRWPKFSLTPTCLFDFSDYPYDVQRCPLILGSWVYPLSEMDFGPMVEGFGAHSQLNFNGSKTMVNNWELTDVSYEVTYWNAYLNKRTTLLPPEEQWRMVYAEYNFWMTIRRYSPYFNTLILAPALVTSGLTLVFYWCSTFRLALSLALANVALQILFFDNLLRKLPPSNEDQLPRIVRYYAINLVCSVLSVVVFTLLNETIRSGSLAGSKKTAGNPPSVLRQMTNVKVNVLKKIDNRYGFQRQIDENDETPSADGNPTTQQPSTSGGVDDDVKVASQNAWKDAAETVRLVFFILTLPTYLVSAFVLLC